MNFILRLIGTGLGLWVSAKLVPGIVITQGTTLTETVIMLGLIALVFTIVNSIAPWFQSLPSPCTSSLSDSLLW